MFAWIAAVIRRGGVPGVFLLMTLENVFPPIPSELIMPMAGYVAGRDNAILIGSTLAGTAGSVIGAVVWYVIGLKIGIERLERWSERHGRWLTLSPASLRRAQAWFARWGALAVLVGRTLPGVRGVICLPAGVAAMPFPIFLGTSTLGSLIWASLLTFAGRLLASHYTAIQHWLDPATSAFAAICVAAYLVRVLAYRPKA